MPRAALLAASILALAACDTARPAPPAFGRSLSPQARATCATLGGEMRRGGLLGAEHCVRRFSDAGKPCTDGGQCLGARCYFETRDGPRRPPVEGPAQGTCAADDDEFGCWSLVKDGRVAGGLCVD